MTVAGGITLDHVFVAVAPGSGVPGRLAAAGFVLAAPREHPGQGTANTCLHLDGGYLELLWARDAAELASPAVRPSGLRERLDWWRSGASPFGLLLRAPEGIVPPFPVAPYRAPFGDGRFVFLLADEPVTAGLPLVGILPHGLPAHGGPGDHAMGRRALGRVHLALPQPVGASPALAWLAAAGLCTVEQADAPCLTLHLGEGREVLDLAPEAPLRLRW